MYLKKSTMRINADKTVLTLFTSKRLIDQHNMLKLQCRLQ